jgi:hypothetical protein
MHAAFKLDIIKLHFSFFKRWGKEKYSRGDFSPSPTIGLQP